MFVTCRCLNITVEAKEVERKRNFRKELKLASVENLESFFKEEITEIKLISAKKHVSSLIKEKKVGSWKVFHCLNCSVSCYAVPHDKKTALINSALVITEEAISLLQKNKDFSPAFKIIVEPIPEDLNPSTTPTGKLKNVLSSLQHQLRDSVRKEITKTEESIRIYSEELYEKLEDFQNRATKDHKALAHKIHEVHVPLEEEEGAGSSRKCEKECRRSHGKKGSKRRSRKCKKSRAPPSPPKEGECIDRQTSPCPINAEPTAIEEIPPSLDCEGVFFLEGMDDEENKSKSEGEEEGEEEESEDSESHDEATDVQTGQTPSRTVAKSLPVEIPPHPPHVYVDKDEVTPEGIDIAASIRALARSVRGDTIFGELPPPRLSTGI